MCIRDSFQSFWSQNVSFLTVCVADQSDVSCSVWIILDRLYSCRNIVFSSLEVDNSVFSSASASAMSNCDLTLIITSSVFLQRNYQRFFRCRFCNFCKIQVCHISSGRCIWAVYFNSHCNISFHLAIVRANRISAQVL